MSRMHFITFTKRAGLALYVAMRHYATNMVPCDAARRRQATFSLAGCVRQYEALF